ncbi:LamB/YcsF family protein [Bogoriella caseilytica]|uniref:5-oxoprolinase subunit A n=1 Tax=Bogoriella caseilytica TaxID=56055 RepID=A0A3N2BGS2_9MICO|nr:5-oxoprolinase subunit PxpA [Bogoriella caseilytica]ROR74452.1 UPF0271 protein [Bogoriella caseilytica]
MQPAPGIDLNADLGEGFGPWPMGDDAAMLDLVTSANVAGGFHAGDPAGIARTLAAAAARGVSVGAHPGYRDLVGFGRRFVAATAEELRADVVYQVGAVQALARAAGLDVGYIKAHGELYHQLSSNPTHSAAFLAAATDVGLPVLALAGSAFAQWAAEAGVPVYAEAFGDRAYAPDGSLVPRGEPGALRHDAQQVIDGVLQLAETGTVTAIDGSVIPVRADSICLHGDTPGAVEFARSVRAALQDAGIPLRPFV